MDPGNDRSHGAQGVHVLLPYWLEYVLAGHKTHDDDARDDADIDPGGQGRHIASATRTPVTMIF
jgi:hypothetical protein